MKGENTKQNRSADKVHLCAGGGCCPFAEFKADGSVVLTEDGQTITMSSSSLRKLIDELGKRGRLP